MRIDKAHLFMCALWSSLLAAAIIYGWSIALVAMFAWFAGEQWAQMPLPR